MPDEPRATLFARPPAKVNLTLQVGPRRDDGYHEVRTVMLRLGLADRLTARLADRRKEDSLVVVGSVDCPVEGNLVLRAMAALRERVEHRFPALEFGLEKRIPLGAGLGGASSDAASTIELAMAAWGAALSDDEKAAVAGRVGSDVHFFASRAPAALAEGRGENVAALPGLDDGAGVLLAMPRGGLDTKAVYARHDELEPPVADESVSRDLADALQTGLGGEALVDWGLRLRDANDLWAAAASLHPALERLRDTLEDLSGRPWLMTGSGSTLFALYASAGEAAEAGDALAGEPAFDGSEVTLVADDLSSPDPAWRYP